LAGAGAATTGTSSSGAFTGGAILTWPLKPNLWLATGCRVLKTSAAVETLVHLGVFFGGNSK
jgi:hypothetical protein